MTLPVVPSVDCRFVKVVVAGIAVAAELPQGWVRIDDLSRETLAALELGDPGEFVNDLLREELARLVAARAGMG
jgi:hypothetical protein